MIPEGIKINGNIEGSGHLRVEGSVRGDVRLRGRLEVGQTGRVEGDLHAEDVVVLGEVRGNVLSQNKLLLKSNCRLFGNITCRGLIVEEGAWLTGRCEMGRREDDKSKQVDLKSTPRVPTTTATEPRRQVASTSHSDQVIRTKTG